MLAGVRCTLTPTTPAHVHLVGWGVPASYRFSPDRYEHFSAEPRHELIMLRLAECDTLRYDTPTLRCGRLADPQPCEVDGEALARVNLCEDRPPLTPAQRRLARRAARRPELPLAQPRRCAGYVANRSCYVAADRRTYCAGGRGELR
jgi:hypothetical protein